MQVIKFDRVVVARRMQHHAIRRRACLFVADTGVAHETAMVIDGSPPVGAVPDEFATGFAASLDFLEALLFVASENDRAAVRRNGFGPPARLRSVFIGGDLSTFSAADPAGTEQINSKCYATLQVLVTGLGVK